MEEQRYEKTRKFIENWANENINSNMPDDEGNDCSMYETLLDIFKEAFTNYSDSDLYSWEALDDYAFERAASHYSFAAKVNYEFADGAYDGYISDNTYDNRNGDISECVYYVSLTSKNAKKAISLLHDLKRDNQNRPDSTVEHVLAEIDTAADYAHNASEITQKLVGKLMVS